MPGEILVRLAAGAIIWDNIFNAVVIDDKEFHRLKKKNVEYLKVDQNGSIIGYVTKDAQTDRD